MTCLKESIMHLTGNSVDGGHSYFMSFIQSYLFHVGLAWKRTDMISSLKFSISHNYLKNWQSREVGIVQYLSQLFKKLTIHRSQFFLHKEKWANICWEMVYQWFIPCRGGGSRFSLVNRVLGAGCWCWLFSIRKKLSYYMVVNTGVVCYFCSR